jgi:two-component system phosphate regulon sensor histidine kinase PhoR
MMLFMSSHWREELQLLLGTVIIASLAGTVSGKLLPCLLSGLLVYLCWHLYQLVHLTRFIRQAGQRRPWPYGLWKPVCHDIHALQTRCDNRNRELTNQRERFRDAVNTLPDAVVILDQTGLIEWSNPAAGKLLNIAWPDSQGLMFTALAPDPLLKDYLASTDFSTPRVITSPVNRAKVLSVFIAPLTLEAGKLLLVASDITRQYYLDTAQRDFVANISHELRTPLTVISGLAEQLNSDRPDAATLSRSTELIVQQSRRMNELVSDLLTLSRLEMQQQSATDEYVSIAELLTSIIDEARALSGAAQHDLQLDIRSAAGLRGNAKDLRTAFSNLVTNAIKHTPNQAQVRVLWQVDTKGAHLSVTDSGAGIAARHIPRLTERLYRVDASHSRDTGGTGLGLAIVKHALERHEAELEIISKVGGGSTFTCHFPPGRVARVNEPPLTA